MPVPRSGASKPVDMMTGRSVRLTAAGATLAIHGVLLSLLARPMLQMPEPRTAAHETGLQIVWIPREMANRRVIEGVEPRTPTEASTFASPDRETIETARIDSAAGMPPHLPVPRPGSNPPALRLSPPPVPMEFNDDLMGKGRANAPPQPDRMDLRLVDRSFGGTMQRMARNRTCGDLRAALQQRPESTMAILRTMTRLGC